MSCLKEYFLAQPWQTIDKADTVDGVLELRKRGERDFLILINNRVLMNSSASRSELALGELACREVATRPRPRVLIGGLGMGLTLRAALGSLPATARIVVAEINPAVITWCRGPLAQLNKKAADDPRVSVMNDDVAAVIAKAAGPNNERYDAIIIDLYEGPHAGTEASNDPFYGSHALKKTAAALSSGGIFAVWGEAADTAFEKRLRAAGFTINVQRPGRGGLRHVVYVAQTPDASS
ncbi:MAG TPA: spermidine synthase [Nitrospirota bacterium]|nr:spermidine synthase [Nitrospirota bacterium]